MLSNSLPTSYARTSSWSFDHVKLHTISPNWMVVYSCVQTQINCYFFRKWRLLVFKVSDVNNNISVFNFWEIKRWNPEVFIDWYSYSHLRFVQWPATIFVQWPYWVVLHWAELMHLIATVATHQHFWYRIKLSEPWICSKKIERLSFAGIKINSESEDQKCG